MHKRRSITALAFVTLAWALPTQANERHHGAHLSDLPVEAGQAAFAALAEIVAILNADPKTDWTKVNLSDLRDHLIDMNARIHSPPSSSVG